MESQLRRDGGSCRRVSEHKQVSQAEISALPILHRFATLSIACWRYWKHNLTAPDVSLSERYVEMVERLSVEFDFSGAFE